ncbi:hypothetical protein BJ878DRAFT_578671 [Calycina marina]|uniref:Myosin class II heavy chain n=1 Tax=Calycina marina TaxID=1763456 RepID=A0A9P7YWA0_9HELO|nr:hypothetical protein BJ878DRAFT_578671 [Calycina marina]
MHHVVTTKTVFDLLAFCSLVLHWEKLAHVSQYRANTADDFSIVCQRAKTSSQVSTPPPAASAEDRSETIQPRREPGSPAFSSSSTFDGGSSPVLPPLPAPRHNGRTLSILTPPRTDSSRYFTASWGSPYEEPISSRPHPRIHRHRLSSEVSEDSPIRHLDFHTPYLRPAPIFTRSQTDPDFVSQDGLISAAVLANRARRPPRGLTEDWIRQHTGGESAENNAWLSDDPGDSEHSSMSGSVSGEGKDWLSQEADQRTPTLKRFLETRDKLRDVFAINPRRNSTATLKQADFSDPAHPDMSTAEDEAVNSSIMGNENSTPDNESASKELPEWRAAALSNSNSNQVSESPDPGPPRLKKKVPWKGKNILVLLPRDDSRSHKGKAPTPLTDKDIETMLADWEQKGHNTAGFDLGHETISGAEDGPGQSRSIWPETNDIIQERGQWNFRVSIPDRREWDAYVQELSEAKLRALGVSFGDEDPPGSSPVPSAISRRTSMQHPALPFSPPVPTGSAMSITQGQNSYFQPSMSGPDLSASQSSNTGSIPSPASMHAHIQSKFNPRQSVSFARGDHAFGSPFQYPQQQSPVVWSPQQMLYQQGGARGGSPSLQNLSSIASPSSPYLPEGHFPQGDVAGQMQHRQQMLQNQLHQQQQLQLGARSSPRLQELTEADEGTTSKSPSKTPEAKQYHTQSNSLQKEIENADYHLEEQFQRQLEHEDYSPHSDKVKDDANLDQLTSHAPNPSLLGGMSNSRCAPGNDISSGPLLHHPQPHTRGHSLSQNPFQDNDDNSSAFESSSNFMKGQNFPDIETNPSNLGTPIPDASSFGRDQATSNASAWAHSGPDHTEDSAKPRRPGHSSKPSMSILNVDAKEFKFDPTKAFSASSFEFGGNSFQPALAANSVFGNTPPISSTSSHISHPSMGSGKGKINVAAPIFTPGQSEFNFSASGPTFRPDAPTFNPSFNSNFASSVGSASSGSEGPKSSSIFGGIELSALGISKPNKKNAAIPIIRPDSGNSRKDEDDLVQGKDGRLAQGEGRIKRAYDIKDDGDSVPLFASIPMDETSVEQLPPEDLPTVNNAADKENSATFSNGRADTPGVPSKSHSRNATAQSIKQSEDESVPPADQVTLKRYKSGLPGYGFYEPSEAEKTAPIEEMKPEPVEKQHKKNSLSATAKPFELRPGAFTFKLGEPEDRAVSPEDPAVPLDDVSSVSPLIAEFEVACSVEALPEPTRVLAPVAKPKLGGLAASRWARSPTLPAAQASPDVLSKEELSAFQASLPGPESSPTHTRERALTPDREPTFEEIDAVMRHLNEVERDTRPAPQKDPHRDQDNPTWHQTSPTRLVQAPDLDHSSPIRLRPQNLMRSDAPSPTPSKFRALPGETRIFSRIHDEPFFAESPAVLHTASPLHHMGELGELGESEADSDWDNVISDGEAEKLQPRARFFDSRVNDLVGGLLEQRLDPLERALDTIQMSIETMATRAPFTRRNRRSFSGALSDADDEDDDLNEPRRSMSPRRDKKMDKMKAIVIEALAVHQSQYQTAFSQPESPLPDSRNVLSAHEEMKAKFGQSMRLDIREQDLRKIVEEVVQARMPSPKPEESALSKSDIRSILDEAMQNSRPVAKEIDESVLLKDDLRNILEDVMEKRAPSPPVVDKAAIQSAADAQARITQLESKLQLVEASVEQEVQQRRAVEDRLSENQRLLRISTEEEMRLREAIDTTDAKVKQAEDQRAKTSMRIALMDANQDTVQKSHLDLTNKLSMAESELRGAQQQAHHWQMEAERALEAARRHSEDAEQANETNKDMRRTIDSLRTQMEESIRVREGMRGMLTGLQEDMAQAARKIAQDNAQRAKKEAELVARQEVLDARLQAEARTRERLELEIERLEGGEREGIRAVSESKRLEQLVLELRQESHITQKETMRYQREFEEARESGLGEVQRTRNYMQIEIDTANNQVNMVRDDLEGQIIRLRNEIDQVRLDSDTTREKHEMLLESAELAGKTVGDELRSKHADEVEDIQTKHDREINNIMEDAQRQEQHLLERLSLTSSKTEHLQDRVSHLEEKLEIAKSAANAAVAAAMGARKNSVAYAGPVPQAIGGSELPEKISPQALRESIMVLQEQLQNREQNIEKLEATVTSLDPDSGNKIQKRDDEIMWLRELLAVRKSDLKDVVAALETGNYDPERVKDAAIRLRANLQMEEQERERAMNGGSAINLPNIAASLRVAASPRVAQAVGPLAAAWGNWRKGRTESSLSEASGSTPSRTNSPSGSFLTGLLTPPASQVHTPPVGNVTSGQRFSSAQLANRPRTMTSRGREKQPMRGSPRKSLYAAAPPSTPPMMRKSSYDTDAQAEDFDAGFYDDNGSAVED